MKQLGISVILVSLVLLSACNRFKYREQYTGNFQFATIHSLPDSANPNPQLINYAGYIRTYDKDALFIRFKNDDSIAPKIDNTGKLTVPGFIVSGGSFVGAFANADSLHFVSEFVTYLHERIRLDVTGVRR